MSSTQGGGVGTRGPEVATASKIRGAGWIKNAAQPGKTCDQRGVQAEPRRRMRGRGHARRRREARRESEDRMEAGVMVWDGKWLVARLLRPGRAGMMTRWMLLRARAAVRTWAGQQRELIRRAQTVEGACQTEDEYDLQGDQREEES